MNKAEFMTRLRACSVHLIISAIVIALAAALVFGFWFPDIYRQISGGRDLFLLVSGVDLVLGPLLTFTVFNLKKGWPHLRRDLAVIGVIQLAGLAYGLSTVYQARPVAMVFEVDRFRVITAIDVVTSELAQAKPEYQQLPLTGPWLLGTRKVGSAAEAVDATIKGLNGADIAQRPLFWQPYAASSEQALNIARPISKLLSQYPAVAADVQNKLRELDVDMAQAKFLPLAVRFGNWSVVLDLAGKPVHFVPVDGFF
jgi:hypothetical protein